MTTPRFEAFLARLYTDAALRERFLRDPSSALAGAGLNADEERALLAIDRLGLELAARSIERKRNRHAAGH